MAIGDSTRINTNIAAFNALHALKYVNRNLEKSQLKLATGWRINEVSDDPAGWADAAGTRDAVYTDNAAVTGGTDTLCR